jgi:oligoendopeptidase F
MASSIDLQLPPSPSAFADATWDDILPYYERLATVPLDHANVEEWLSTWSRLEELVGEASELASIAFTSDTTDPAKEAAHLRFSTEIMPRLTEQSVRLARRLLDSGFSRPDLETVIAEFRTDAEIFREANVPIFSELEELGASYEKITGGMTVEWEGERKTLPQLQPLMKSPDRGVRERAWRLSLQPYIDQHDAMADIFDRMVARRQAVARNAGFANYEEFTYKAKHRFDYTPADAARFHRAVELAVVPAVERLHAYRRDRLGVDTVRPWDLSVDLHRSGALQAFHDVATFVRQGARVFGRVDDELGAQFRLMASEGLLDLDSREGKAPGGYCTTLHSRGRPFIFMNAVGVPDDVNTLVHEAGHCFHAFAARELPLIWQRGTGMEAAELASMSMELLAAPYLARPDGYYSAADVRHAWIEHLEDVLVSLPHIASVDAFQSWVYTSGRGHDRDARDRAWLKIRSRFDRGLDWSGLETQRVARWYRQLHIFLSPFYYIEYGLAQLGALQIWRNALRDPRGAVARYKQALSLGGTRRLPEIYAAAGASLVFDPEPMAELVEMVETRLVKLRAEAGEEPAAVGVGEGPGDDS